MDNQDIKIKFDSGTIRLLLGEANWQWAIDSVKDRDVLQLYLNQANILSIRYRYSPAHGQPGFLLATRIANNLKGKAVLPEIQKTEEDLVY